MSAPPHFWYSLVLNCFFLLFFFLQQWLVSSSRPCEDNPLLIDPFSTILPWPDSSSAHSTWCSTTNHWSIYFRSSSEHLMQMSAQSLWGSKGRGSKLWGVYSEEENGLQNQESSEIINRWKLTSKVHGDRTAQIITLWDRKGARSPGASDHNQSLKDQSALFTL